MHAAIEPMNQPIEVDPAKPQPTKEKSFTSEISEFKVCNILFKETKDTWVALD